MKSKRVQMLLLSFGKDIHFLAFYLEIAMVFNTCILIYRERPNT